MNVAPSFDARTIDDDPAPANVREVHSERASGSVEPHRRDELSRAHPFGPMSGAPPLQHCSGQHDVAVCCAHATRRRVRRSRGALPMPKTSDASRGKYGAGRPPVPRVTGCDGVGDEVVTGWTRAKRLFLAAVTGCDEGDAFLRQHARAHACVRACACMRVSGVPQKPVTLVTGG
jgi:hypothetical protein